jgi:hypothetical protein
MLLTIMSRPSDHPSPFMIVRGKRLETGRLALMILELVGGRAHGSRRWLQCRDTDGLAPLQRDRDPPQKKG